jgi:flavin-dependent dehydrogenase
MGGGPAGAHLYALLRRKKPELKVSIFDMTTRNACGTKGCAWGASWPRFAELSREVNIEPEKYVLGSYDHVLINDIRLKADVIIIDKPTLIKDLLGGISPLNPSDVDLSAFERVVDASGVNRAYLSPQPGQPLVDAVQMRLANASVACPTVVADRTGDYTWLFPLGSDGVHIGSLSSRGIETAAQELNKVRGTLTAGQVVCRCSAKICRSGPIYPFIEGKVWGLGEAIGMVDPIACAGIVPAMTSAKLMTENWDDGRRYEKRIWRNYFYMVKEAKALAKFARGEKLLYRDLMFPHRAFETLGIFPGFRQIIEVASKARKTESAKDKGS